MILYPAIDLKEGMAVRLEEGDMARATAYSADPAAQAARFEAQGFSYLHVVDLNGAFAGKAVNAEPVRRILAAVSIPVQLGGGIRTRAEAERWLELGIERVILGTVAVRNPALVKELAHAYPGRIAVGIDAKGGRVAVEGWAKTTELAAEDLARRFEDAEVSAIIFTDIARDGLLKGLNLEATAALAAAVRIPVIASGGLKGLDDVRRLLAYRDTGLSGAIAGKALYTGALDAAAALALIRENA